MVFIWDGSLEHDVYVWNGIGCLICISNLFSSIAPSIFYLFYNVLQATILYKHHDVTGEGGADVGNKRGKVSLLESIFLGVVSSSCNPLSLYVGLYLLLNCAATSAGINIGFQPRV